MRWYADIQAYACEDEYLREHPGLLMDVDINRLYEAQELSCGFFSEDALQSWFSDLIEELILEGFEMAIYWTEHFIVSKSGRQVFFRKDSAPEYGPLRCGTQYL